MMMMIVIMGYDQCHPLRSHISRVIIFKLSQKKNKNTCPNIAGKKYTECM